MAALPNPKQQHHIEKWLSALGGMVSLLGILLISQLSLNMQGASVLVASMGASAVLLFAVPHGALSQPWPVLGGHLVFAAALAVALAIGAMHYLNCIHPPGGATALSAVIGGDAIHQLGFQYVLTPVLLNVIIVLVVAILFNYPFHWRRYPLVLRKTA